MSDPRPHRVIWITTDHMRFDCVGAYAGAAASPLHTPNLDALAQHGVNFLNCFTQAAVSMPSRASFMTGLYPQQTGVTSNGRALPPAFRPTVATAFKAAGFRTAHIGKLHFQPHEDHDLDPRPRSAYGFDVFSLSEEKGCYDDAYVKWLRGRYPEHAAALRIPRPTAPDRPASLKRPYVVDAPWQATQAGWVVETASRHLSTRGGREFLHLGFYDPHPPLNPVREAFAPYDGAEIPPPRIAEAEWRDKPQPLAGMLRSRADWTEADFLRYRRHFYALVTQVDLAVGYLLEELRRREMLDDTLIVFSSDHGDMCGDHAMTAKGPHFFDEVMHVPLILHWPAGLGDARRDASGLVEMVDLLPTLLELAGGRAHEAMAGRSGAAELLAGGVPPGRDDVFACHQAGRECWAMLRTARWKYLHYGRREGEVLYDLSEEPAEVRNLAAEGSHAAVLAEMRGGMLERTLHASGSPLPRLHPY
jgi:arylsulfatase A-like enzyme